MQRSEIEAVVALITYKQGWSILVREDFDITARGARDPHVRPYLQVKYDGTGEYGSEPWTGRKWMLSQHMTRTEVVCTAFKAVMSAEEHETRELFKYLGHEVFGPHFDVDDIVRLRDKGELHQDVRADAMQGAT